MKFCPRLHNQNPRTMQTPATRQSKGISTCSTGGYPLARQGDIHLLDKGISPFTQRGYPFWYEGDIHLARKGISLLRTRRVRPLETSLEMPSRASGNGCAQRRRQSRNICCFRYLEIWSLGALETSPLSILFQPQRTQRAHRNGARGQLSSEMLC